MEEDAMTVQFGLAIKNFVGPEETPDVDEILHPPSLS